MIKETLSLRTTITLPFTLLIVITFSVVGYLSFTTGSGAVEEVAADARQSAYQQTSDHLEDFLSAPHQANLLNKNYIEMSGMDINDPIALQNYFWQQLKIFKTTSYIYYGNNKGGIMLVARRADGSFVARQTDDFIAGKSTVYSMSEDGRRLEAIQRREAYDSTGRPWYKKSEENKGAIWTDIYTFFLEGTLGITAALPIYNDDGELRGVLATDILLSHIQKRLAELTQESGGEIFIFEPSGLLVASSSDERPFRVSKDGKNISRINAGDSISPVIRTAYHKLIRQFDDLNTINSNLQLEFEIDDNRQFLQLSPYTDSRGINWLIGTTAPEAPLMAKVYKNIYITIALSLLALLIAIALSFYLARRITVPLSNLKQAALSLTTGNWGQQIPNDGTEEIHSLANSFNIMAQQLQGSFSRLKSNNQTLENTQAALRQANRELTQRIETRTSELGESEERYKRLADAAFEGIVFHAGNVILDVNKSFEEILGYSADEVKGKNLLELAQPEYRGVLERAFISNQEKNTPIEAAINHKDGSIELLMLRSITIPLQGEEIMATVLRNTGEAPTAHTRGPGRETTEQLTSLRYFQQMADNELRKAQRFDRPFVILLLNIDKLQEVNDTYGYSMGDEVLRTTLHICSNQLRDIDIVGQLPEGEIAIILPETRLATAEQVATRLSDAIAATSIHHDQYSLRITAAIGIAAMKRHDESFEELFQRSDQALYQAKKKESGRIAVEN